MPFYPHTMLFLTYMWCISSLNDSYYLKNVKWPNFERKIDQNSQTMMNNHLCNADTECLLKLCNKTSFIDS